MDALIANARFHFHKQLFETNTLTLTSAGVASNADTSSRGSKAISRRIVDILVEEQHHAVSDAWQAIRDFDYGFSAGNLSQPPKPSPWALDDPSTW